MILTDASGRPIERPRRADFSDLGDFIRAHHAYRDRLSATANGAFDSAFRTALKKKNEAP